VDLTPRSIFASLLDREQYLCSVSTMYRLLRQRGLTPERRQRPRSARRAVPRLCARGPNEVWSWDITKLHGPSKGELFYLYVIIDIYSRYVVGWRLERCESAELAREFIEATVVRQGIDRGKLTLHADRGASMRSGEVSELLRRLEVCQSHSRPRTPDDNPYSESQFKTLKYHPTFPGTFDSFEQAQEFCRSFFSWYNHRHYHVSIALLTPFSVHSGQFEEILALRQRTMDRAYAEHAERFVKGAPKIKRPPDTVWINEPKNTLNKCPDENNLSAEPVGAVGNA
jgi:putative transposase